MSILSHNAKNNYQFIDKIRERYYNGTIGDARRPREAEILKKRRRIE